MSIDILWDLFFWFATIAGWTSSIFYNMILGTIGAGLCTKKRPALFWQRAIV